MTETEGERQNRNGDIVDTHVYVNQTYLVEKLLEKGVVQYDDIENQYPEFEPEYNEDDTLKTCQTCEQEVDEIDEETKQCEVCFDDSVEASDIFEWYAVSSWMINRLEDIGGEPILKSEYGDWWGRTCTGQAIKLDSTIDNIRKI